MRINSKPLAYTQAGMIATMGLIATGYVFPQIIPSTDGLGIRLTKPINNDNIGD